MTLRKYFHIISLWIVLINLLNFIESAPTDPNNENFKLIILHNNDIHGRFEQTNAKGGNCKKSEAEKNKCFGGIARIAHT